MFNQIIAGKSLPQHLSSDRDPLFRFHRWVANLRILEVEEIKSIPYVPMSDPFVERLIGTIRREFLDHVVLERRRPGAKVGRVWRAACAFRCAFQSSSGYDGPRYPRAEPSGRDE
jgi:hypothetical protein